MNCESKLREEVFVGIKGFEGLYEVSNKGNIRSLKRTIIKSDGFKYEIKNPKNPKKIVNIYGYEQICLSKSGIRKTYIVHRIVANHFVENLNEKPEVNHIDGNKSNNDSCNLEWVTSKENSVHAAKNNLYEFHKGRYPLKLNKEDAAEIRKLAGTLSYSKISKLFNISTSHVGKIIKGVCWKDENN